MKCPHCLTDFHDNPNHIVIGSDADGAWGLVTHNCPACERLVIYLAKEDAAAARTRALALGVRAWFGSETIVSLVRPKGIARTALPPDVPEEFAADYRDACLVLPDSPKASAALSRRCLQNLLREKAETTKKDLADQIDEVLTPRQLPPYLAGDLDAIRNIGAFAAHPLKSKSTGEILDVEPEEAEWNLNVLEGLFTFYFIDEAAAKARRDALNVKLKEAGKPPMKQ